MRFARHLWIVPACLLLAWLLLRETPLRGEGPQATARPSPPPAAAVGAAERDPLASFLEASVPAEALPVLEKELFAMEPSEAVRRILAMLDSGKNRATGMDFVIGADQRMEGWPSLRTYLLDVLHRIDPQAAARHSRGILESAGDPDEWALALRNIARVEDLDRSRDFLIGKTEELIRMPGWQARPSIGYLNAFDVLVHVEAVESTPLLSGLVRDHERRDLAHAAFLTLDRLVQRRPAEMLGRIGADESLLRDRPEMAAQQFARADLRDPEQRRIVREWLLGPAREETELKAFSGIYPNNNHFVSHNLLSTGLPAAGAELAAHDREVRHILSQWAADPEFSAVREHLMHMIHRLDGFMSSFSPPNPND